MKLLAMRARTEAELDRALQRANIPETDRKAALARLRELGYMDDREVARVRAKRSIERGEGARLTALRLSAQGVKSADARSAIEEAKGEADDDELARTALLKRLKGRKPKDDREKQKLLRALIAKGHRPAAAARALGLEWEGDEEIDS
ncbi:MAG: regulatory protein RecX [Myxococcales bacterium]|nr:recombination regulator RecX [Myxococcales bacterium]